MSNPPERRSGRVRFFALARSLRLWQTVSFQIAGEMGPIVALQDILAALRHDGFSVFTDKASYSNIRLIRMIVVASGSGIADTEQDWDVLRRMSPAVRALCVRWGLCHGAAIALRDAMRVHYPGYSLLDLSCFLCLAEL